MDYYNFYTGKDFEAYQYLGAHIENDGITFRTFLGMSYQFFPNRNEI